MVSESESDHVFRGPCLVINHGVIDHEDPNINQTLTLFDAFHGQYQSKVSPETTIRFLCECHGEWLVLHGQQEFEDGSFLDDCCLLNVVTMEKLDLPPMDGNAIFRNDTHSILYGSRLFLINEFGTLCHCKIGADQFTRQELDDEGDILVATAATIFQGKLYTVAPRDFDLYCAQLEDVDTNPSSLKLTMFIPGEKLDHFLPFRGHRYTCLIESCDQLWLVDGNHLARGIVNFEIFRVDFENKCWEQVHSIGDDRAIFVDAYRGFSAPVTADSRIKGNCIYFVHTDLDRDEFGAIYAYDLEDHSITMLSPLPFQVQPDLELRWLYIN